MSLAQIGRALGRDSTTVSYWVRKHGLTATGRELHAPRGGISREQLAALVEEGLTVQQIAERLERSGSTIRHWLRRHGLKTVRTRPSRVRLAREAERTGSGRFTADCPRHGESEFLVFGDGRSRCARCNVEAVVRRRKRVKDLLVEEAGGACQVCGYDRCRRALQFHHLDPSKKSYGLSERGIARSLERARAEAAKCVLLCSNCHAEVEEGLVSVS
jgi:excisionase family DNA binding protein